MTRIISEQVTADGMADQHVEQAEIQFVEIVDPVYAGSLCCLYNKKV